MPGGKSRLLSLLTSGLKVGAASESTFIKSIIAGSVSVTSPCFAGNTAGSTGTSTATITGLTACHSLVALPQNISPCMTLLSACPGTDTASFVFGYIAGSGGAAAAITTTVIRYIATRT